MATHSTDYSVRNVSPLRNTTNISYHSPSLTLQDSVSSEHHSSYHNEDRHAENLPRPPRAITSRATVADESREGRQPCKPQRSLTGLLPQFPALYSTNSQSPSRSPIKEISAKEYEDEFMPTLTGDTENVIKLADKSRGGLSSWFSGTSAPVPMGVPTEMVSQLTTPVRSRQRPNSQRVDTNSKENMSPTTPTSSTSLFGKFFSPAPKTPTMPSSQLNDELLRLDINTSLFPDGRNESDPFSPEAFQNLLMNAEGLLSKMQTTLTQRTKALNDLAAEKSARDEEFEEADIRARSLKNQLDDMAAQLLRKDTLNAELVQALALEKNARRQEAVAREKSIALVRHQAYHAHPSLSDTETEDLGFSRPSSITPTKDYKRGSYSSSTDFSSSDDDSEQVFSRSMSPTASISTFATARSSSYTPSETGETEIAEAAIAHVMQATQPRPSPVRQKSTFQKVLWRGGRSGAVVEEDEEAKLGAGESSCGNCRGRDVAFAWDTVGVLKAENKGLKERVASYQQGIDGALDAVLGLGF